MDACSSAWSPRRSSVSKKPAFKVNLKAGTFETLEQLDSSISPAIYVVVPTPGNFDKWIYGMMVPTLPDTASEKVKQHTTKLKQYVMLLDPMKADQSSAELNQ